MPTPVAIGLLLLTNEATPDELDAHVAPVRFWVVPSGYVPVTENCTVLLTATVGLAGVTVIAVGNALVMVIVAVEFSEPTVA